MNEASPNPSIPSDLINVNKAAGILDVSSRTVWRMIADKQLTAIRLRGCTRLLLAQVQALLKPNGNA